MTLLKEIAGGINETEIQEYRFNVVLRTKVGGFKMYLETNINAEEVPLSKAGSSTYYGNIKTKISKSD